MAKRHTPRRSAPLVRSLPAWARFFAFASVFALLLSSCGSISSVFGEATPTPGFVIVDATPAGTAATSAPTTAPAATVPAATSAPATTAPTDAPTVAPTTAPTAAPPTVAPAARPPVRLAPATLIAIFRGQITNWSDARIQADNPGVQLPNLAIRVIFRSDSSGTTRAVTEYFVAVDEEWRRTIGAAYRLGDAGSQPWPVGEGTNGSSGIIREVQSTPGAIGYVASTFAQQANLPVAVLQNAAGNWVTPESSTIREAANSTVAALDAKLRGFSVNAPGQNAYPISAYTWAISCPAGLQLEQAQALTDFLYWALTDPQAIAATRQLGYEPVPAEIRQRAVAQLEGISVAGTQVFLAPAAGRPFQPRSFSTPVTLSGSGATFPGPLYKALIERYAAVQPSVQISYTPQGSTAGREDLLQQGTVQFAGTEEAVVDNDSQITRAECKPAPQHNPVAVGGVGFVYNLP